MSKIKKKEKIKKIRSTKKVKDKKLLSTHLNIIEQKYGEDYGVSVNGELSIFLKKNGYTALSQFLNNA